ncbi:ATP-binding cassette domain-containing protein [Escherichia coli]|nr:ATP-binding cassette domain-containing protein [Escherichia coli]
MEMYFKRMKDEWTGLVEQADPLIRAKAAEIALAHAHYLSIEFYRIVRIDPHAEEFLSNEQVERQLKSAMERWIINVLSAQVDDVERLIQIQHTVAEVHARIGIPVEIVEMGFRVLKKILYPVIFSSDYSAAENSLNPRLPVWRIITEPLWIAKRSSEQQRRALAEELAVQVGIRPEYLDRLPHAFSGGQRQRIAIARALSSQPDVIVLDEPTSALDISVQAQILNLLVTLQENHGLTYVLISHNVSVIRHMSDRVAVMYLGQIVELGDAQQVLTAPAHPYTRLLLDSLPAIDKPLEEEWALRKTDLPGNRTLPQGCFFYERCPLATSGCEVRQSLAIREDGRELRCWRAL